MEALLYIKVKIDFTKCDISFHPQSWETYSVMSDTQGTIMAQVYFPFQNIGCSNRVSLYRKEIWINKEKK
ncbi:MAG: hypothetical protein MSG77_08975 [Prevotella sp.]|nr:hypothetical protein [Prevotella sp.]